MPSSGPVRRSGGGSATAARTGTAAKLQASLRGRASTHELYNGAWIEGSTLVKYYGGSYDTVPFDAGAVSQTKFTDDAGKTISLIGFGQGSFPFWNTSYKSAQVTECWDRGCVPVIHLMTGAGDGVGVTLDSINAGTHDAAITSWFQAVDTHGEPVIMHLNHEMNGTWFTMYSGDPTKYVQSWQRIWTIAETDVGCTNVSWCWNPNFVLTAPNETAMMNYYPGDTYVDWVGFHVYQQQDSPAGPSFGSFTDLASRTYDRLAADIPSKPQLLGEWGSSEFTGGTPDNKGDWLRDALETIRTDMPKIKAVSYFNRDGAADYHSTLAIQSSAGATAGYADGISDSAFLPQLLSVPTSGKVPVP